MKPLFTKEEIVHIEKNLNYITEKWFLSLVNKIIREAKTKGITNLYWNSSDTIDSGDTHEGKLKMFYEMLPKQLGFKPTQANLRGRGDERLWVMPIDQPKPRETSNEPVGELIPLERIPQTLRKQVVGILSRGKRDEQGRKVNHLGPYTKDELRHVHSIINPSLRKKREEKNQKELEERRRFSYDTEQSWYGAQRFTDVNEVIFKQKISGPELQKLLGMEDPVIDKFLAYIYSQSNHFDDNVIGFALVAPINETTWVLNEIQTDSINNYIGERKKALQQIDEPMTGNIMDADSIRDRLVAQGKSVWVDKLADENFLQTLQNDPRMLDLLPDDAAVQEAGGISEWLRDNPQHGFNLAKNKVRQILSACYVQRYRQ
jgi:hypothetical protein